MQRLGISERFHILDLTAHKRIAYRDLSDLARLCAGYVGDSDNLCRNVARRSKPRGVSHSHEDAAKLGSRTIYETLDNPKRSLTTAAPYNARYAQAQIGEMLVHSKFKTKMGGV